LGGGENSGARYLPEGRVKEKKTTKKRNSDPPSNFRERSRRSVRKKKGERAGGKGLKLQCKDPPRFLSCEKNFGDCTKRDKKKS